MPTNRLDEFNRQVLLCQDEAFDFAFALLGDQSAAEDITCQAFCDIYTRGWRPSRPVLLAVLQRILAACPSAPSTLAGANCPFLACLPVPERVVLWLVDRQGLDLAAASVVLCTSRTKVASLLLRARHRLASYDRIK